MFQCASHHLPASSWFFLAGIIFLHAITEEHPHLGRRLANLPLTAINTSRPLHGFGRALLKESLTTPLGRCVPFGLFRNHHVFQL